VVRRSPVSSKVSRSAQRRRLLLSLGERTPPGNTCARAKERWAVRWRRRSRFDGEMTRREAEGRIAAGVEGELRGGGMERFRLSGWGKR